VRSGKGLKAARVLSVRGVRPGLADYHLVELTDPAGWYGLGKVSLKGEVLAATASPLVRMPTETAVLSVLAKSGHRAAGQITWLAVAGPPMLGACDPFLPLATAPAAGGTAYVNYRLQVFVDDPQDSIAVQTENGVLRLRGITPTVE
jgi:hypothetical protein